MHYQVFIIIIIFLKSSANHIKLKKLTIHTLHAIKLPVYYAIKIVIKHNIKITFVSLNIFNLFLFLPV